MGVSIPSHVLSNRGALSPMQAICAYLCDDPAGPRLSQAAAAQVIGAQARQQVATHLKRARSQADDFGWLPWYLNRASDPTGH